MLFNHDYEFKGLHAEKVNRLTAPFSGSNKLFNRNIDVYIIAPLIGFLYNHTAPLETSSQTTNILYDTMSRELNTLWFNYRLITLLDKEHEPDVEKRIDSAFRNYGKEIALNEEERYEEFVRGGIDVLYEKLIIQSKTEEDYLNNLYDFIEEFESRYGQNIEEIVDLCKLCHSR